MQVAAEWRAAAAPLDTAPVSMGTIAGDVAAEGDRAATLSGQIDDVAAQISALRAAVAAANGNVSGDAENATALQEQLDTAAKRLRNLQSQLKAPRRASPSSTRPPRARRRSTPPPGRPALRRRHRRGGHGGDDEGEDEHDDTERILPAIAGTCPLRGRDARRADRSREPPTTGASRSSPRPPEPGCSSGRRPRSTPSPSPASPRLQAADDRAVVAGRQPYLDAVAATRAATTRSRPRWSGPTARPGPRRPVVGTSGDVAAYQAPLDELAALVAEVQGSAAALPARIKLPSVSMHGAVAVGRVGRRPAVHDDDHPRVGPLTATRRDDRTGRRRDVATRTRRGPRCRRGVRRRGRWDRSSGSSSGSPAADDAGGRRAAAAAWAEVRAEFDAVDRSLSRFRDDSELTALNGRPARGRGRGLVAAAGDDGGHRPCGTDDRRPVRRLRPRHARADRRARAPLSPLTTPCTSPPAAPSSGRASVRAPAVPVDTGGIGKGLALRWAAARAVSTSRRRRDSSSTRAATSSSRVERRSAAGGSASRTRLRARTRGRTARGRPPRRGRHRDVLGPRPALDRRARAARPPPGRPATGEPARTGLIAVTVAAADPAWAEVWSKALFLAGRAAIGEEARPRGLAAWWVDDSGRLGMTPEARVRSLWVAEARVG